MQNKSYLFRLKMFKISKKLSSRSSFKRSQSPTTLDRLRSLNYKFVILILFVVSAFLYSYRLFERKLSVTTRQQTLTTTTTTSSPRIHHHNHHNLILKTNSSSITVTPPPTIVYIRYYSLIYNSFGSSDTALLLDYINSIIMNFIAIVAILWLNILTLIKTKKCLNRKRALTTNPIISGRASLILSSDVGGGGSSNGCATNVLKDGLVRSRHKISKAEMNISLMVFTSGIIAVLGHGFTFLYRLPIMAYHGNFCVYTLTSFSFSLSYVMNFFIYLRFHKNFRKCFSSMLGSLGKFIFRGTLESTGSNSQITIVHL